MINFITQTYNTFIPTKISNRLIIGKLSVKDICLSVKKNYAAFPVLNN